MARRRKKKARAKAASKSAVDFTPPKGYRVAELGTGDFAQTHDFEAEPVLEGQVQSVRTVDVKQGRKTQSRRVMTIKLSDGRLRSVWESKRLEPFFADKKLARKGTRVWIRFIGYIKIAGRRQGMKDFAVATK